MPSAVGSARAATSVSKSINTNLVAGRDGLVDEFPGAADRLDEGRAVHRPAHVDAQHHRSAETPLQRREVRPGRDLGEPGPAEGASYPVSHQSSPNRRHADQPGQPLGVRAVDHPFDEGLEQKPRPDTGSRAITDRRPSIAIRIVISMSPGPGRQRRDLGQLAVEHQPVVADLGRHIGPSLLIDLDPDRLLVSQDRPELLLRPGDRQGRVRRHEVLDEAALTGRIVAVLDGVQTARGATGLTLPDRWERPDLVSAASCGVPDR